MKLLAFCLLAVLAAAQVRPDTASGSTTGTPTTVESFSYQGWPGSFRLSNGTVEAVIVPAVGRVMQFHFLGEDAVLWESSLLYGKATDPTSKEWQNFGGDKSWPSPQDDWPKMIGRGWPPPATFDAVPLQGTATGNSVELVSPVDPAYGIRVRRRIELEPGKPVMRITTIYEKVHGAPVKVGIGVITQLRDPLRAFMVLPPKSRFPKGYVLLQFDPPYNARFEGRLFSLARSQSTHTQIGSDADTLLWMNDRYVLRIDSPRVEGAEYTDQGSNAVIYTNAGPDGYVELETFGPLTLIQVGDKIERTNTYTLMRRLENDVDAEARRIVASTAPQ